MRKWKDAQSEKSIEQVFRESIKKLYREDKPLFEVSANERSISHCLAKYLAEGFPDWDVDCEYNKLEHRPKEVPRDELIRTIEQFRKTDQTSEFGVMLHSLGPDVFSAAIRDIRTENFERIISLLGQKQILTAEEQLKLSMSKALYRKIFPDIIVHKRQNPSLEGNLLVIEVKYADNLKYLTVLDFAKLSFLAHQNGELPYQLGLYVEFGCNALEDAWLFERGEPQPKRVLHALAD